CACEHLAWYQLGKAEGARIFQRLLPSGVFQSVAKTIYACLRNGFVHHYGTQDIRVGKEIVQLAISWRRREHLSVDKIEGRRTLVLNANTLCRDLFRLFDEYREELEATAGARDHFIKRVKR